MPLSFLGTSCTDLDPALLSCDLRLLLLRFAKLLGRGRQTSSSPSLGNCEHQNLAKGPCFMYIIKCCAHKEPKHSAWGKRPFPCHMKYSGGHKPGGGAEAEPHLAFQPPYAVKCDSHECRSTSLNGILWQYFCSVLGNVCAPPLTALVETRSGGRCPSEGLTAMVLLPQAR